MNDFIPGEELVLEKIRLTCQRVVANSEIINSRLSVEQVADRLGQRLVGKLEAYIAGLPDHTISVHKQWPATWWDAFKFRWFPEWMVKRWPVKYERIDVEQKIYKAVCPYINLHVDSLNSCTTQRILFDESGFHVRRPGAYWKNYPSHPDGLRLGDST